MNKNHPKNAKKIDLEDEGSCSICFIQKAWEKYYKEYLITKYGKKLNFSPPKINQETKITQVPLINKFQNPII